jgi:hypothetical protein
MGFDFDDFFDDFDPEDLNRGGSFLQEIEESEKEKRRIEKEDEPRDPLDEDEDQPEDYDDEDFMP